MYFSDKPHSVTEPDYLGRVKVLTLSATQAGVVENVLERAQREALREALAALTDDYRVSRIRELIALGRLLEQTYDGVWTPTAKVVRDVL